MDQQQRWMNILIATNGHKGFATSLQVGEWLKRGIEESLPVAVIRILPIADGGEGTIDAFLSARRGGRITVTVHDAHFRERQATIGLFEHGTKTSVLEIAEACGSALLAAEERDTMRATSYGVGELIRHCLNRRCQKIIVGLGGCMASDGGMGMAQALGARFLDSRGKELEPIGNKGFNVQSLPFIKQIDITRLDPRLQETEILVAADVTTPLLGATGQAVTFGPQKGADEKQIAGIEQALTHWNSMLEKTFGRSFDVPLAGAAGGLGAGLAAFAGGKLRLGIDIVLAETGFENELEWADIVVTGEGKLDRTTLLGKAPLIISDLARRKKKRILAVIAQLESGLSEKNFGFDRLFLIPNHTTFSGKAPDFLSERLKACGKEIAGSLHKLSFPVSPCC